MKIALCLFGSVGSKLKPERNVNNYLDPEICFKSIKEYLIDKFDTDIFFHTWSSNYNQKLIKIYKPKNYIIEKPINFEPELSKYSLKYINCYDDISKLIYNGQNPEEFYKNLSYRARSRWHSQSKVLYILKKYKERKKINYDFIIQSRFDLVINKSLDLKNLNKKKFYLVKKNKQSSNSLYDIFFVSNFINALKLSEIKKKIFRLPIDPSQALYFFFKKKGIKYSNYFDYKDIILFRYHVRRNNFIKKFIFLSIFYPLNLVYLLMGKIHKLINKFLNDE